MAMSEQNLRETAGGVYFERGAAYYRDGKVRSLAVDALGATAVVDGSRPYRVRLAVRGQTVFGDCNCPMGDDGLFCKHCVAAGLAWIDASPATTNAAGEPAGVAEEAEDGETKARGDGKLRPFLLAQDRGWLADRLLEAAGQSIAIRAQLLVDAGAEPVDVLDLTDYENEVGNSIGIGEFTDWCGMTAYLRGVDIALGKVADLIPAGFPEVAAELSEYALDLLEDSMGKVDDPDGGLRGAMRHAERIHLWACEEIRPDPVELAETLARRALRSDWNMLLNSVPCYARLLGVAGLTRFAEIVDQAWAELPPFDPAQEVRDHLRRFRVEYLRQAVVQQRAITAILS
jgi:uncharacterized Zn finger protein